MPATDRVKEILSWYGSDNPGVKANLYRMMATGRLATRAIKWFGGLLAGGKR